MSETSEAVKPSTALGDDPETQTKKNSQQEQALGRGLAPGALFALAVVSLVVGIGVGIGAGYGIFHQDSTAGVAPDSTAPQWLLVLNAENGNMTVSPEGATIFQIDGLRSRAPAFTNVPDRVATLTTRETALDFIQEDIESEKVARVILSFKNEDDSYMVPVSVVGTHNPTGDSPAYVGVIQPEFLGDTNNRSTFRMDDVHLYILGGTTPSQLDFS